MAKRTPPFPNHTKWTQARFWQFVRSNLRKAWLKYPPRFEALNSAKRVVTGKRHKYEYQCAHCRKWHKQKDVNVDHIIPAGTLKTYEDLPAFVEKLFPAASGLQILCKKCHKTKGESDNEAG